MDKVPEKHTVEMILMPHSSDILRESFLTSMLDISEGDLILSSEIYMIKLSVVDPGILEPGSAVPVRQNSSILLSGDCLDAPSHI